MKILKSAPPVFVSIMCVAGCHDSAMVPPPAAATGNTQSSNSTPPVGFVVRGQVYDPFNGPISDGTWELWVELPRGFSYAHVYGVFWSGNRGRYETTPLPESTIYIGIYKQGLVQPCVYRLELRGPPRDLEQDIEVMSQAALESFSPPRPSVLPGPAFTGMVFETTPTGRQPVVGAEVWIDGADGLGVYLGRTYTDFGGKYFLCNLPADAVLMVSKPGFQTSETAWIGTASRLDIELERLP